MGGGEGVALLVVLLRQWAGRNNDGAESQYNRLWFHREDGVVLRFKENLQKQNETGSLEEEKKKNLTAIRELPVDASPAHSLHHVRDEAVRDAGTGLLRQIKGVF